MSTDDLIARIHHERKFAEERLRITDANGRHEWEPPYGFTSRDRVLLAAAVEAIRRKICIYGGASRCDCKYGLGVELIDGVLAGSEASGCPELRSVVLELLHPEVPQTRGLCQADEPDIDCHCGHPECGAC